MKKILLLFMFLNIKTFAQNAIPALSVNDFEAKLATKPTAQLLDVRTTGEYKRGHLKKALNVNFNDDDFEDLVKTKIDKNRPVFLYCFSGGRSANAATFLREMGYKEVYDMAGGFAKWTASSKPYVSASTTTEPIAAYTMENVDKVIRSNSVVLVDFFTEWCGPCKKMTPILYKLADENKAIKLLKLDAEINDGVANVFQVEEIPTYIIFKNGRQVWRSTGEIPENELREILKKLKI